LVATHATRETQFRERGFPRPQGRDDRQGLGLLCLYVLLPVHNQFAPLFNTALR
jgi:hypothetical protein